MPCNGQKYARWWVALRWTLSAVHVGLVCMGRGLERAVSRVLLVMQTAVPLAYHACVCVWGGGESEGGYMTWSCTCVCMNACAYVCVCVCIWLCVWITYVKCWFCSRKPCLVWFTDDECHRLNGFIGDIESAAPKWGQLYSFECWTRTPILVLSNSNNNSNSWFIPAGN